MIVFAAKHVHEAQQSRQVFITLETLFTAKRQTRPWLDHDLGHSDSDPDEKIIIGQERRAKDGTKRAKECRRQSKPPRQTSRGAVKFRQNKLPIEFDLGIGGQCAPEPPVAMPPRPQLTAEEREVKGVRQWKSWKDKKDYKRQRTGRQAAIAAQTEEIESIRQLLKCKLERAAE